MKKILTLSIAIIAFASVQGQVSKEDARRIILGDGNGSGKNYPTDNRDIILGGDNRTSYPTYPSEERQRKNKSIYNNGHGRYDRDDNCNNGKHKGWYKKSKNKNWKKGNRDY